MQICNRCKVEQDDKEFIEGNKRCSYCREYVATYYEQNRARAIKRARKCLDQKGRVKINEEKRERYRRIPISPMLCTLRKRAKDRGLEFNLTREDIVIPEFCPVLGVKLEVGNGHSARNSPSVDRIDPTKGYIKGNVHIISHKANSMKSDATLDELKKLVMYLERLENEKDHKNAIN